jgi:long-chain acyl-CoA synthetase
MTHRPSTAGFSFPAIPLSQRTWLDAYPPGVPSSLAYPNIPVSGLLESAARRYPDRKACTLYNWAYSYAEMADQARRLARSLADMGVGPGRTVAMLLPNIPEYLLGLQAAWLTGATVLQLSPLMVAEELAKWLKTIGCEIAVTLDLLAPNLTQALEEGVLKRVIVATLAPQIGGWRSWLYRVERVRRRGPVRLTDNTHMHRFDQLLRVHPRAMPLWTIPEDDVALMVPTGGTTGSPKVVMLTHRNLVANALQIHSWSRLVDRPVGVLGVLPFFHAYGLSVCLLSSLVGGWTVHMVPRFEVDSVLDLLVRYRIEMVPAVPAMIAALNRKLRDQPRDLSFIQAVVSGASALDPAIRKEFAGFGVQGIVEGYGLSEASPVTHVNPLDPARIRPGTIGVPLPDTEARIVDASTGIEELPIGAVGELIVRGPQVMKGYWNNPVETDRALRGGWLYTGDLAKRDRDGYFQIVDRKKDIIKTSGFLVYPAEVEEVLLRFPGIAEAAVIGVPDADRGEVIKALLVTKNGKIDLHALEQHCCQHLGKQKRPRQFEFVAELPKNFLGKVQRRKLRELSANSTSSTG